MDLIINQTKSLQCGEFIELEEDKFNASEEGALTLIIKAITTKTIYLKPLQNILLKAWNPSKGMKIQPIQGNTFSVSFNHEWDRKRIMDSRPWSIMSSHLVVRDWPTNCAIDDLSFDYSPFWIRIIGLTPMHMTKKNAEKIGSRFGKVLEIDFTADGKISWNKFLRIQVELNITQPLYPGFHRTREASSQSWINLRYERLPDFCFNCGRLGHVKRNCIFPPLQAPDQKANPFGPRMRAEFDGKYPIEAEWNQLMMGESAEQKTHLESSAQLQPHMSSADDASEKSTFGEPQTSLSRVGDPTPDKLLEDDLNLKQRGVIAKPKSVQIILSDLLPVQLQHALASRL
ncbi:hypothetical protein RJ639_013480 [Escallonia herrerae]|uniref:CCHC-type domain-containing protein n=1 Tax=Escallonia herrerae TaxID=1293975 RepID=A0AA88VHS7_9ASTE|nr:hypothetical protein RJ639_013480 [Escallonia herrerae]